MLTAVSDYIRKHSQGISQALWLFLASLGTLAFAAYPIYVIRPFREQTPAALDRALWVLLHNKPILLILALAVTALALLVWRRAGWISRLILAPSIAFVMLGAVSAWINPYELMFHPFGEPHYIAAQQGLTRCERHGHRRHSRWRESRLSDSRNGLPPHSERPAARVTDGRHLLNALPHGSGLDPQHERTRTSLSSRGH